MAQRFNDLSDNFSLELSFKKWLETMLKSRAASDYPSRLRRFFREEYPLLQHSPVYDGKEIYSLFGALMGQGADGRELVFVFLDLCIEHVCKRLETATTKEERARFNNYHSALFAFQKFLLDLVAVLDILASQKGKKGAVSAKEQAGSGDAVDEGSDSIPQVLIDLALNIGAFKVPGLNADVCRNACNSIRSRWSGRQLTVPYQVMRKKFRSQFNTERRVSAKEGLLYPIGIIVTIINEHGTKGSVTSFWDTVIKQMKVIVSASGETVLFGNVSSLSIVYDGSGDGKGQLVAILKGKGKTTGERKNVYTEVYTGTDEKRYELFRISSTSQINRDHDEPVADVLAGLSAEDYPCLAKITEAYRNGKSKKSQDVQSRLAALLGGEITAGYANGLFSELKLLFGLLHFTLMEEHENKKKSNK